MKKERYAYVEYQNSSYLWLYKCDNSFKVGDVVRAPILNYQQSNVGIIRKIKKKSNKSLPIEYDKILVITEKLDIIDYEEKFFPIRFMKRYIDKRLTSEWWFAYKNNWIKVFNSSFGACISYEKDGVFTGELNECTDDNYFLEYIITSPKNFKTKLLYFETILSKLYYKEINIEKFKELLSVI